MDCSEDASVLQEPPDPEVLEVDPTFRYIRVMRTISRIHLSLACFAFRTSIRFE